MTHTEAIGSATTSAIAALISASFAGLTSVAAWTTIRGRRPKLKVEIARGSGGSGVFVKTEGGPHLAIRIHNVREPDVGVNQLYFEPKFLWDHPSRYRSNAGHVIPGQPWYITGTPALPVVAPGHITTDLGVYAAPVLSFFTHQGAIKFRVVVRKVVGGVARSEWVLVPHRETLDPETVYAGEA